VPEFHAEPYLHLAGLSHQSALITWGAFYFKTRTQKQWKLVDDHDLRYVHPPRQESIGARSAPYGPARVNVYDMSGELAATASTDTTNFCWVNGLAADTRYRYEVIVKDELWGHDERWDWVRGDSQGLMQNGGKYVNEFRTFPDPAAPPAGPFTFMVLGDYGTGMRKSTPTRRQFEVAQAMQAAFDTYDVRLILTTGDNIYAGRRILGLPVLASNTGDEDDDWFFTFFQPYRYMINRVPVYPCIGNHDTAETEEHDDRDQLLDNMYIRERMVTDEASDLASIEPGLFYRFRYGRDVEFICLDTSKEGFFRGKRLFEYPKHWQWIERTFGNAGVPWRLSFCHHPPFCAGPDHHNTDRMEKLVSLFMLGGVRAVFSGHEHNFQHSHHDGIDYFVTGAGSKVRKGAPDRFDTAHTVSWSDHAHFLLVTIDGASMTVRAVGEPSGTMPADVIRHAPSGASISGPIAISR
jgi:tartrate-resistant acid phosphatase type 5